jgi:hypothetical protein
MVQGAAGVQPCMGQGTFSVYSGWYRIQQVCTYDDTGYIRSVTPGGTGYSRCVSPVKQGITGM